MEPSASVSVGDLVAVADALWPPSWAEPWDNPGLAVGDPEAALSSVLLCVDVTHDVIDEAKRIGAQAVVSHHPTLFTKPATLREDHWPAALLTRAIQAGIALFSAHTNADAAPHGVSQTLADALGVLDARPIVAQSNDDVGLGRVGRLTSATTLARFAHVVARALPATARGVAVSGSPERPVRTVAVCGGSGGSLLAERHVLAADVFVTADLKHHDLLDARARGQSAITVSHWASESLWLPVAADALRERLPGVSFSISRVRTDPWDWCVGVEDGG